MPSKKVASADDQQERLKFIGWVVGYIDGEGCFSVSLFRNKTTKFGWQVFPEFVVTQGEKSTMRTDSFKGKDFMTLREWTKPAANLPPAHRTRLPRCCARRGWSSAVVNRSSNRDVDKAHRQIYHPYRH